MERNSHYWTTEEIQDLEKLREQGVISKKIAEFLGRSVGAINNKAGELGLRKRTIDGPVRKVKLSFTEDEWSKLFGRTIDTGEPVHVWGRNVMLKALEHDNLEA